MNPATYEYQSDFCRGLFAQGKTEGRTLGEREGRAALVTRLLTLRFGALTPETRSRIAAASISELDATAERLLTAHSLQEALAPPRD